MEIESRHYNIITSDYYDDASVLEIKAVVTSDGISEIGIKLNGDNKVAILVGERQLCCLKEFFNHVLVGSLAINQDKQT